MSVETETPVAKDAKYYFGKGYPFQILFFVTCMHAVFIGSPRTDWPPVILVSRIGGALFFYCLIRIYLLGFIRSYFWKTEQSLITTDIFKFTRHPMYTGMALMTLRTWWPTEGGYSLEKALCLVGFLIGMVMAGYYQEKETLARFDAEAEEYYRKTPRLFFLYPFMRR